MAHEIWDHALQRAQLPHHCFYGLLPLHVASLIIPQAHTKEFLFGMEPRGAAPPLSRNPLLRSRRMYELQAKFGCSFR